MKNMVAICLCLLTTGMPAAQDQSGTDGRAKLAGAWRLVWLERPGTDGKMKRVDCTGLFIFASDGHAAVQVMERRPEPQTDVEGPEQYSAGGYEASWGSYDVDERAHTFTFHIEGARVRSLIGKDLPRAYELSGNRLIVHSTLPNEHLELRVCPRSRAQGLSPAVSPSREPTIVQALGLAKGQQSQYTTAQ